MEYFGYLYVYFRWLRAGKDLQQVYFALSRDGLHFQALNGNRPILESDMGTKGVRDPHILRSEIDGKFYILATDLDVNENRWKEYMGNGSRRIAVWKSEDMVHWGEQQMPLLAPEDIGCVWAPKVCFDEENKDYVVFFSGSEAGTTVLKVFYCRTKDFVSFTQPQVLIDKKRNTEKVKFGKIGFAPKWISYIDSTTIKANGKYYRFTKNEVLRTIQCERSDRLLDGFQMVENCVAGERGVEGPCVYHLFDQDRWVLLMDGHLGPNFGVGYFPLTATDRQLEEGMFVRLPREEYALPEGCKHGSVLPVTKEEYDRLMKAFE